MTTETPEKHLTLTIAASDLETLLRRIVREVVQEVVREEVVLLIQEHELHILDALANSFPEDPEEDARLLADALVTYEQAKAHPERLISWEDARKELARAEAAGELPIEHG
ncbi:MAG: hypothetical protein HC893_12355 [Chloroflexaceae bacterium]|nr:hypothetical protein [Chloroflexaceae bacterium]NJL34497.1 hypothetical protein [Chloroflexaceae bacterium]NJO04561.1 hypothetical protein [Chloroflexaceae bacterium]